MKRFLLVALLVLPAIAEAAIPACTLIAGSRSVSCTCASGTCDAPTAAASTVATGGLRLGSGLSAVDIQVCPAASGTISDGSAFDVYFFDVGAWAKFASYTSITNATADGCVLVQGDSPGKGIPILSKRPAWMLVVPNGAGAGALTIKLLASGPSGAL